MGIGQPHTENLKDCGYQHWVTSNKRLVATYVLSAGGLTEHYVISWIAPPPQTLLRTRKTQLLSSSTMANNDRQFSPNAKAVVELAEHLAFTSSSLFTGTEHLLQALLDSPCR